MPTVFLSPSTQEWNGYISGGNEEQYMNMLVDKMEPLLMWSGITYVRNDPARNVLGAIEDSNSFAYDVHLALHTNAGGGEYSGVLKGIDIYYSPYSSYSRSLAVITANNLEGIYPDPQKVRIVPTTSLAEVTRPRAVSVLAELGYHDNADDEAWIKNNLNAIARTMVQSLCDYFGIPFVESGYIRRGRVKTDGSNLNLRRFPSTHSEILGKIPAGGEFTVFSKTGHWYVVKYNGTIGYAYSDYVSTD